MKTNKKRILSYLIILIVYVLATFGGIYTYQFLNDTIPFYWRLLVADVVATVITFVFSVISSFL